MQEYSPDKTSAERGFQATAVRQFVAASAFKASLINWPALVVNPDELDPGIDFAAFSTHGPVGYCARPFREKSMSFVLIPKQQAKLAAIIGKGCMSTGLREAATGPSKANEDAIWRCARTAKPNGLQ